MTAPVVIIIGGPNGAGKTTVAPALVGDLFGIADYVNADMIAAGLSAFDPERAAFAAGRIMLARLRELAAQRRSFAFETTLASRTFAPWLAFLSEGGYECHLLYIWLESPNLAIERVRGRAQAGGHDVPAETIRRRYARGLRNLFDLYAPLCRSWRVYDNSADDARLIIESSNGVTDIFDEAVWRGIRRDET